MPYDNEYNRKVASEVNYLNRKYITHSDATGQGTIDYTQSANISGGGIVSHILGMMGLGRSGGVAEFKGASASKKHHYEDDSEYSSSDEEGGAISGGTKLGHPKQCSNETGQFDELQGGAILGLQSGTVIDGKKGKRVPKGKVNNMEAVKQSFGTLGVPADASKTREMVAMSSVPAANAKLGIASKPVGSKIEGGSGYAQGTFRDTGFGDVMGAEGAGKKKRGRPKKQTKKDKEDEKLAMELKEVQEKESSKKGKKGKKKMSKEASKEGGRKRGRPKKIEGGANPRMVGGTTTNTKETVQSTPKATLSGPVPKAQMPSSTLSGFGKKGKSARAEIVRKVMKEKGLKLIEASKYVKAHNLY